MKPLACALGLLIGISTAATLPGDAGSPRRSAPFQNTHIDFEPKGLGALIRWRYEAWRQDLPPAPSAPTPRVAPDLAFVRSNAQAGAAMTPSVTWIGHATTLLQVGGITLLTDPMFSHRASPLSFIGPQRAQPPGIALDELPRVDVVLISHNHYDHLDEDSVRALNAQPGGPPRFLVPLGVKAWFADIGIDHAVELDWWQSHTIAGVDVVLTPVQHWSGRGLTDRMHTLWGGYAVLAPGFSAYFAGDTGYSPDFRETRRRLRDRLPRGGFDLALLPIGAYEPRWFMTQQHVNPDEAVQMHQDLGARRSLGMHWGTFELTDEALDEPPRALAEARRRLGVEADDFFVLAIGETRRLTAPHP